MLKLREARSGYRELVVYKNWVGGQGLSISLVPSDAIPSASLHFVAVACVASENQVMEKPLGPTGEFFRRRDAWRKHPSLSNQFRHATPGLGIAIVAFGIYLVGEAAYNKLASSSSSSSSHH